jgi:hypothetical protein
VPSTGGGAREEQRTTTGGEPPAVVLKPSVDAIMAGLHVACTNPRRAGSSWRWCAGEADRHDGS